MDDAGESEAKKLRVDEDKTSTYDLSEDEDIDCDETPFTLVSYKKKRPEGIPVVFRPSEEGSNFWQVNPNRAASEIVSAAKEKRWSFSVNVASLSSARHLLSMSEVAGLGVKTSIPASYTRNVEQEQRDKRSYSATLKRPGRQGPITERHDQSTGNAAHCAQTSHESGRSAQQQPVPLHQQPHLTPHQRRQHSPQRNQSSQRTPQAALRQPATTAPGASASTSDYAPVPMAHVLLPMLFTALRAILSAIPQANNLPEVKALLSMESLVIPQPPSDLQ
ncbi:hypothetical protein HPB50_029511 [Hyalomma asiaticum]|nr:hypothetical protein HPB50_029511 [Hyalomma asiaticum]